MENLLTSREGAAQTQGQQSGGYGTVQGQTEAGNPSGCKVIQANWKHNEDIKKGGIKSDKGSPGTSFLH